MQVGGKPVVVVINTGAPGLARFAGQGDENIQKKGADDRRSGFKLGR